MMSGRHKPAYPLSRVKHSTTASLDDDDDGCDDSDNGGGDDDDNDDDVIMMITGIAPIIQMKIVITFKGNHQMWK